MNPLRKEKETLEKLYIKEQYLQEFVELCHRSKHGSWLASHTQAQPYKLNNISCTCIYKLSVQLYFIFTFTRVTCSSLSLNGAFQNIPSDISVILLIVQYSTVLCFCFTSLYLYLSTQPYIFTRNGLL